VQPERDVENTAVHEESRRAAHTAAFTGVEVLEYVLPMSFVIEVSGVTDHVQSEVGPVTQEMLAVEMRLVVEKLSVHLPEPALRASGLCRLGRRECMWVHVDERKVPKYETDLPLEPPQDYLDGRCGLLAVGTFEVAVLDKHDRCVIGTERMVQRADVFDKINAASVPIRLQLH